MFGGVLMGLRRFDLERSVSLTADLFKLGFILLFLRSEWGVLTMALITLAISIVENTSYVVLACRQLPQLRVGRAYLSREVLRECGTFSTMAFLNGIAYQLTFATDSVVIGSAVLLTWLLAASVFEWLYKPAQQGRKVAYLTVASFVFLAMVMALLVVSSEHASPRRTSVSLVRPAHAASCRETAA